MKTNENEYFKKWKLHTVHATQNGWQKQPNLQENVNATAEILEKNFTQQLLVIKQN